MCYTIKERDITVKQIFKHWTGFFGYPKKILVDDGDEFKTL